MIASANPLCRLAPRTSSLNCVSPIDYRSKPTLSLGPHPLDCAPRTKCRTTFHLHPPPSHSKPHLRDRTIAFNIHNSHLDHRDRDACGFLLVS
jgi:hypothetical protein